MSVSQKMTHISLRSGFLKAKTRVLLKNAHKYSGWILQKRILQSTAKAIRRPKPSHDKEFTIPAAPGTLKLRK